jgi:hypothetical protein
MRRRCSLVLWATLACAVGVVGDELGDGVGDGVGDLLRALGDGDAAAREALEQRAGRGDTAARLALADAYLAGAGVPRNVPAGVGWLCLAAHDRTGGEGVTRALWLVAEYLRTGGGLADRGYVGRRMEDEDPLRAYFWFAVMGREDGPFEIVDLRARRLGGIGAAAVGRALFASERAAMDAAARDWRPERAPASGEACLRLPGD